MVEFIGLRIKSIACCFVVVFCVLFFLRFKIFTDITPFVINTILK